MTDINRIKPGAARAEGDEDLEIPNLAAETNRRLSKRTVAIAAGLLCMVAALAAGVSWKLTKQQDTEDAQAREQSQRTAAALASRQFDPGALAPPAPRSADSAASAAARYEIPKLDPNADDGIEPIGVKDNRSRSGGAPAQAKRVIDPMDAPMLLPPSKGRAGGAVSDAQTAGPQDELAAAKAELQERQRGLRDMMQMVQQRMNAPTPGMGAGMPGLMNAAMPTQPPRQPATPQQAETESARDAGSMLTARQLPDSSLVMPMGTSFTCSLTTRVVTATAGNASCITSRAVFGADKRVVLLPKGSILEGEYKMVSVRPGMTRIPVLWTRVRTPAPESVIVDLDSPATGALGEAGLGGHVDNRWGERLGAALLLSLIDDAVKVVIADKQDGGGATVVLGGTADTSSKLAEQVLSATINIPPLLTANQGDTVGVYVRHDVDFRSVYALRPAR
ncbi:TrbI/VirB10 family protein [Azohydromonas aeria]|uniref:TrbI/VirB10 family protein n=1 Tax=Azohydromonas aeria TaxID=2590212 RepID=UPI001E5240AF|nr:TrbI/VirB10 family protein [Azohydromonas aeria]